MPISAPRPNSPPSANWVEAFQGDCAVDRGEELPATVASSATIASVRGREPWRAICATAASMLSTIATEAIASRYLVSQFAAPAATTWNEGACACVPAHLTQPVSARARIRAGASGAVTVDQQRFHRAADTVVRRIFASTTTARPSWIGWRRARRRVDAVEMREDGHARFA